MKIILLALITLLSCGSIFAQDKNLLEKLTVKAGTRTHINLAIPAGKNDPATYIPISILKGLSDGPTVLMVSGVHGYEFAPILAAERLAEEISPASLEGTLIIVRVAHLSAFESRVPYVNPFDRKNLNRSFPGISNGTQTERIAYMLSSVVIPSADFVFDVHSGDGAEWLEAFIGVYGGPLSSDYKTALGVARSMRFPNIVRYSMNTQKQVDTRRSLNRQAVAQGVPTLLVEVGQNGRRDIKDVNTIVSGVKNALAFLGMLPKQKLLTGAKPRYFDGTQSVVVQTTGIWTPDRHSGPVQKNEVLGVIRDYAGEILEEIKAPTSGYGIYGLTGPPVRKGDSVMSIAIPAKALD